MRSREIILIKFFLRTSKCHAMSHISYIHIIYTGSF